MSDFRVRKIKRVMGYNAEQTEEFINLMDEIGAYPNWSEASNDQLLNFFQLVLLGPCE